ncbi:hypothetical protein [Mesorhizobium sp. 128a]
MAVIGFSGFPHSLSTKLGLGESFEHAAVWPANASVGKGEERGGGGGETFAKTWSGCAQANQLFDAPSDEWLAFPQQEEIAVKIASSTE